MNVVLIDDEQIALDFLQLQLKKTIHVNVMDAYVNPEKGMPTMLEQAVDVEFFDTHLVGEDVRKNDENT